MPRIPKDPTRRHMHKREPTPYTCKQCGGPSAGLYCEAHRIPQPRSATPPSTEPAGDRSGGTGQRGRRDRLEITLPWHTLVSDNDKTGVLNGRLILTRVYRAAKKAQHAEAIRQVPHPHPHMKGRVRLTARIWFPDTEKERDAGNFRKALTDAMEGVVYERDSQIKDERWIDAGVDPLNARAEIVVEVYVADDSQREAA